MKGGGFLIRQWIGAGAAALASIVLLVLPWSMARAQSNRPQVITGTVRDSTGTDVATGEVLVTAARTFSTTRGVILSGKFRVVVDSGTGDYLVVASAPGYRATRARATPGLEADSAVLTLFLIRGVPTALAPVAVQASRPQPRDLNSTLGARGGAQELVTSETVAALGAGDAGDLAAAALLNPALVASGSGISALGLSADQSRITINGLPTLTGTMPRDMRRRVRVGTTNYDPATGGFSAALLSVELLRGTTLKQPTIRVSQDGEGSGIIVPSAARLAGPRSVVSFSASGEARPGTVYYNVGASITQRATTSPLFGSQTGNVLTANGIDTAVFRRVSERAAAYGVPFDARERLGTSTRSAEALGRIDWMKSRWGPLALTIGAGAQEPDRALSPLENATRRTTALRQHGSLVLSSTRNTRAGWLIDWRIGLQALANRERPLVGGPALFIRVPADSSSDLWVGLGGSGQADFARTRTMLESAWQAERMLPLPGRGTHQFKLFLQQQTDRLGQTRGSSSGEFRFASLEDWELGKSSAYSRLVRGASNHVMTTNLGAGVGDVWRPTRFLLLQVGLRADFGGAWQPTISDSIATRALGTPATLSGSRFVPLLSPRLGFSWTYRKQKAETPGLVSSQSFGTVAFPGNGVLRGGIGLFRSYVDPEELLNTTGLSRSTRALTLVCGVGDIVPSPWFSTPSQAPSDCAQSGVSAAISSGSVLPPRAVAPAAWRGNMTISHALTKRVTVEIGADLSYAIHQRTVRDRNLPYTIAATLASEGGRESYLSSSAIDPGTGVSLAPVVRPLPSAGPVWDLQADGRNRAAQLSLAILPEVWHQWFGRWRTAITRADQFGTDFTATGPSRAAPPQWTRTTRLPAVRSVLEFGRIGNRVAVGGLVVHESGVRFTPLVAGDVNGDGVAGNDRAFVSPELLTSPAFSALPAQAQACLRRQSSRIAAPASCIAPSTLRADLSLTLAPNPGALSQRGGGRTTYTLRVANVPALLDDLLHRTPRRWGATAAVDPVVSGVRGYDPTSRSYLYAPNPNFGRSLLGGVTRRAPYLLSFDVRVFLGSAVADQEATRALRSSRLGNLRPTTVDEIASNLRATFDDPYQLTLEAGDSLLLQRNQIEALEAQQRELSSRVYALWRATAVQLADRERRLTPAEAGVLVQQTYRSVIQELRRGVLPLRKILTPPQLQRLPADVAALLSGQDPLFHLR